MADEDIGRALAESADVYYMRYKDKNNPEAREITTTYIKNGGWIGDFDDSIKKDKSLLLSALKVDVNTWPLISELYENDIEFLCECFLENRELIKLGITHKEKPKTLHRAQEFINIDPSVISDFLGNSPLGLMPEEQQDFLRHAVKVMCQKNEFHLLDKTANRLPEAQSGASFKKLIDNPRAWVEEYIL